MRADAAALRPRLPRALSSSPGTPFIIAAVALLAIAAVLLAAGSRGEAEVLAEYAYITLTLGVALELAAEALRGRRRG